MIKLAKGEELFTRTQWVKGTKEEVFKFFSEAKNLERITPDTLGFKILESSTEGIEEGSLIDYKLKIHGLPFKWKTRINSFIENQSFIDEQLKGPYSKWVHTHEFEDHNGGTLIIDRVIYKLPFGLLGRLIAGAFVKKDINNIFDYRHKVIDNIFNSEEKE